MGALADHEEEQDSELQYVEAWAGPFGLRTLLIPVQSVTADAGRRFRVLQCSPKATTS